MKKVFLVVFAAILFSSCGVIFGGKITKCQYEKLEGERRKIRPAALIGDIVMLPFAVISIPVDFATGAIYRPCNYTKSVKRAFKL